MVNTTKSKGIHLTALLNGKVVGGIMVSEEAYPRFWLFYFAVDKNYQRRGIGSMLLKKAESKIKKNSMLLTDLEERDKTGLKFYFKNGFIISGRVNKWFENGREGLILVKRIGSSS